MTVIDESVAVSAYRLTFEEVVNSSDIGTVVEALNSIPVGSIVSITWTPDSSEGEFHFFGYKKDSVLFIGTGFANSLGESVSYPVDTYYISSIQVMSESLRVATYRAVARTFLRTITTLNTRKMIVRASVIAS